MKPTNLDMNDGACLHVVHILQHPTSRPTTRSTQDTMVNDPKKNHLPLPARKYGTLTKKSTWQHHQANKGNSGLEAQIVPALGGLRSLRSKKKLWAEKRPETHCLSNEENEKWIEDYFDRETAVARKRVQDAETAIMQQQKHMTNVEKARSTTTKPETTCDEMSNAIGDSLSDLTSSEDDEDGHDEDDDEEDTELGNLSDDDEPGWVMGTIPKTVQHLMESFRQKQMRLDQLTQRGLGDAACYFRERDIKYGTTELNVQAVMKPPTYTTAATPSPTTFAELMQVLDRVPGQSLVPHVTSRQGCSQRRLDLETPQEDNLHSIFHAWCDAQFITEGDCQSSLTREHLPQRIASLAAYHIEIGFGRRHGDGSCHSGKIYRQIGTYDNVSRVKAICSYFVTCQLFLDFSDQIVRQDYSSVCVQGPDGPCKCSRYQIK